MAEKLGVSPEMLTLITNYATKVLGVLVLLFAGWILSNWCKRASRRVFERARLDVTLAKFFSNMAKYIVLIAVVITALSVFGIQTTSFAAVLAAAGFAVGMGFQNSLSNFSAGVMLLIFRPFKVGQYVTAGGTSGTVNEIELFTTTLDTPDNRRIVVPNSAIFSSNIENFSHHPTRRIDVSVGTAYDADLDEVREVLCKVAEGIPDQPEGKPFQVILLELGASSIDWQVRVWNPSDKYWPHREKLIRDIKKALDQNEIGIPFPQMALHFETPLQRIAQERSASETSTSVN